MKLKKTMLAGSLCLSTLFAVSAFAGPTEPMKAYSQSLVRSSEKLIEYVKTSKPTAQKLQQNASFRALVESSGLSAMESLTVAQKIAAGDEALVNALYSRSAAAELVRQSPSEYPNLDKSVESAMKLASVSGKGSSKLSAQETQILTAAIKKEAQLSVLQPTWSPKEIEATSKIMVKALEIYKKGGTTPEEAYLNAVMTVQGKDKAAALKEAEAVRDCV